MGNIYSSVRQRIKKTFLEEWGYTLNEDGQITKELSTEEDFKVCPLAIMYAIFLGEFGGNKEGFYEQLKFTYHALKIEPDVLKINYTPEEIKWLDETPGNDEYPHWDMVWSWLDEELVFTVNKENADKYYDEVYEDWEAN